MSLTKILESDRRLLKSKEDAAAYAELHRLLLLASNSQPVLAYLEDDLSVVITTFNPKTKPFDKKTD